MVKCTYCGRYFYPEERAVYCRYQALMGQLYYTGECRLYCSNNCKLSCPTYGQHSYPKGFKEASSREVQPELRQMVLKRDNYTCIKCGKTIDEIQLHRHHILGIRWKPIESADIDICITLCIDCHKKVHKIPDCRYVDLQCPVEEMIDFCIEP